MRVSTIVFFAALSGCQCGTPLKPDTGGLTISPVSVDFGAVPVRSSAVKAVHLQNSAQHDEAFTLTVLGSSRPGAFSVASSQGTLAAGETLDVEVTYLGADALSADVATLSMHDVGLDADLQVALAGRTSAPLDAGIDAGPADAGVDAGPVDAGPADAGLDAGAADAGMDAGFDAGLDLPSFDGGGTCGNANVLDLPLLNYPAALNLDRTEPSIVPVGNDFALSWIESLPDAGLAVFFQRVTAAARPVIAPTVVTSTRGSEARLAWNGQEFGLAWDDTPDAGVNNDVLFARLDPQGVVKSTPLRVPGLYRPGMTDQVPVWNPNTKGWAVSWGWWQSLASRNTATTSIAHVTGNALAGPQQDFLVETPWRATSFAAADAGYLLAGAGTGAPLVLRRLDDAFATTWTTTLAPALNGHDLKVVVGSTGYGVVWVHFDGSTYAAWFAAVDSSGALHPPVKIIPASSSASEVDVTWNGSEYTTVVNALAPDGGWEIDEVRFDQTGTQKGAARNLVCNGAIFDPRIAFGSGVHFVTYEQNNGGRRVLLFP